MIPLLAPAVGLAARADAPRPARGVEDRIAARLDGAALDPADLRIDLHPGNDRRSP